MNRNDDLKRWLARNGTLKERPHPFSKTGKGWGARHENHENRALRGSGRQLPMISNRESIGLLEGGCAGLGDGVVLIARASAHSDGADDLAIFLERDSTREDHDFPVIGSMDTKELPAGL